MDLGLQRDLDVQVEVQPQAEGVALPAAAAAALLLLLLLAEGLAADLAERVGDAAAEALRRLPDAVHAAEGPALLPLHHLLVLLAVAAVGPLRRGRLLLLGPGVVGPGVLVDGLLLLPAGLALLGRHSGGGDDGGVGVGVGVGRVVVVVVVVVGGYQLMSLCILLPWREG